MKNFLRIIALMLMLTLFCPAALAATPTPPPSETSAALTQPPAEIQVMLNTVCGDAAAQTIGQFSLGYVNQALAAAGVPMAALTEIQAAAGDSFFRPEGLYHCSEEDPGKLLQAYQLMDRAGAVPQKGFLVLYGCSYNKAARVGLVCDVTDLGGGKYRITTLEADTDGAAKTFIRDYDMTAAVNTSDKASTNLTAVPEEERAALNGDHLYDVTSGQPSVNARGRYAYYVNRFLMPWVPGDPALSTPLPEATAEPTPAPTAESTAEPVIADVVALTPPPAATQAPAGQDETAPGHCQGKDGSCTYATLGADDPFCRACDRNDNGIEDSKE